MQATEFFVPPHGNTTAVLGKVVEKNPLANDTPQPVTGATSTIIMQDDPSQNEGEGSDSQDELHPAFSDIEVDIATDELAAAADPHYEELMTRYSVVSRKLHFLRRNGEKINRAMKRSAAAAEDWANQFQACRASEQRLLQEQTELYRGLDAIRDQFKTEALTKLEENIRHWNTTRVRLHGDFWADIADQ